MFQPRKIILEPYWWSKYEKKDIPQSWTNPHLESVFDKASPDKQDVVRMAIGMIKEPNTQKKTAKFYELIEALKRYDIYIDMTPQQFFSGGQKYTKIMIAAVMEVFTPTGIYSRGY